jgi:uncharacterized protein (DUF58 family)
LRDSHSSSILITPPQLALPWLRITPRGRAGDQQLRHQALEREISDAGVREYASGDSLRRIHWRVSAHLDGLVVRQFESARSGDWWIFVDLDASAQRGTGAETTLELLIVLAASLVSRGLKEHHRVGLAFVGPRLVWLKPQSGPVHLWRMLRALSMAAPGDHSLAQLMGLKHPSQNARQIVITPSTDPSWIAVAGSGLKGGELTTLLVDPHEFGGSANQDLVATTLARRRIPYTRIPGTLLGEAYASAGRGGHKYPGNLVSQRYLESRSSTWQSMD